LDAKGYFCYACAELFFGEKNANDKFRAIAKYWRAERGCQSLPNVSIPQSTPSALKISKGNIVEIKTEVSVLESMLAY
jgi:hypothetical protein